MDSRPDPLTRRVFPHALLSPRPALRACLLILLLTVPGCVGPVKILQLSDMHILDEASTAYPRGVVDAMNAEGGDLVLVCGDLATEGNRGELELAKSVLDELVMPYHPVLGNHDAQHSDGRDEKLFRDVLGLESSSYHFVKRGIHFIALDTGCGTNADRPITPESLAWLQGTVDRIPDNVPIILFTHYPYARGVRYEAPSRSEVLAVFVRKRLLAVISGHFHGNTEVVENGVLFTTTACSSSARGNHDGSEPKGYRIFRVDRSGRITTEFREVPLDASRPYETGVGLAGHRDP